MSIALNSTTAEMQQIFSPENEVKQWLKFESTLARVQSRLGMIPEDAADTIEQYSKIEYYDIDEIERNIGKSVHPIMPIVNALSTLCGADHGEYVHWGATTQDVIDTGLVLRMKDADSIVSRDLDGLCELLAKRASAEKATVMPGRTHAQHAVPISLGYKLAVFLDELKRHQYSLSMVREVALQGQFGGAAGTLSSLGVPGLQVRKDLMLELELGEPDITWHVSRDRIVQYLFHLSLIAGTLHRLGREIMELQRDEIGEVHEPFHEGKVGSSTMPHKRNPAKAESLITLGQLVNGQMTVALSSLSSIHERDKGVYSVELDYVPKIFCLVHRMLETGLDLVDGFTHDADRMMNNIQSSGGFIFSENVMMTLAEKIGRQKAHHVLYRLSMQAYESDSKFIQLVHDNEEISELLTKEELEKLFDPLGIVDAASEMVDAVCGDYSAR